MSGSEFVEMLVGVGASRVRDLFEMARKNAPCIIFIDELDAVGRERGAGLGGGNDEREQTLNQVLVEMDGFDPHQAIIVLAATNRPDVLDPALLRPGRFDRQIVVDRPDRAGREAILHVHVRDVPLAQDVKLGVIAASTVGMVGADLANLVNEAALCAARHHLDQVTQSCFEEAMDRIMMGAQRPFVLSPEERRVIAYHESGHTLVAMLTPEADPVHKVTIIPRGQALGVTQMIPLDDRHNYPRTYLLARLAVGLGGRVAEELAIGEVTTGAENDLMITGPIPQRILYSIEAQAIDLVVMCSRGETGFKRWPLGSVAQKIIRHSPVPVLVLHESAGTLSNQHPAGQRPVRILVALDGSSLAEAALEPAMALATALSAPGPGTLHLLCVVSPPRLTSAAGTHSSHLDLSEARMYMQTTAQAVRKKRRRAGDLVIHTSVVEGEDIAETIIRVAEEGADGEACDAIALASHGRGGLARRVMGSIAERLLYGTRLPLLVVHVVPQPGDVKERRTGERISVRAGQSNVQS